MKVDSTRDYVDYMEQHESYNRLMEEYSQTEIFKEIIHFLNQAFPSWRRNCELGYYAAKFVETTIQNIKSSQDKEEYSTLEMLTHLYLELSNRYEDTKFNYQSIFSDQLIINFESNYEEELYDKRYLPYQEYSDFYDNLFDSFEKIEMNKVRYNFEEELVY